MPLRRMRTAKDWTSSLSRDDHDRVLWVSFRRGSRQALETLYRKHVSGMYHHGMFVCRDPDLVRDGMQDLFSRLWLTRTRISDADSVQMYLYRSLQRIILVHVTRQRRQRFPFSDDQYLADTAGSAEETLIEVEYRNQQVSRVRKALDKLTKHQREVIILRFFNGLSYPQIAEIMDLQVDSVYNLSSKAIDHLRMTLQFGRTAACSEG